MDVVYTLGTGSEWDNNEIRYSLRSIEKHLKGYGKIFIVGECPEWLTNVIHIPFNESGHASKNILDKLMLACNDERVSEDFMFFNDDFFLIANTNIKNYPFYFQNHLPREKKSSDDYYNEYTHNTYLELKKRGLPTFNFDVHHPIIYNKKKFIEILSQYDFSKKLIIKSIYCNHQFIQGKFIGDVKIKGPIKAHQISAVLKNRHIFSTSNECLTDPKSDLPNYLFNQFPNSSIYERQEKNMDRE